jgi:hypothetical protein
MVQWRQIYLGALSRPSGVKSWYPPAQPEAQTGSRSDVRYGAAYWQASSQSNFGNGRGDHRYDVPGWYKTMIFFTYGTLVRLGIYYNISANLAQSQNRTWELMLEWRGELLLRIDKSFWKPADKMSTVQQDMSTDWLYWCKSFPLTSGCPMSLLQIFNKY